MDFNVFAANFDETLFNPTQFDLFNNFDNNHNNSIEENISILNKLSDKQNSLGINCEQQSDVQKQSSTETFGQTTVHTFNNNDSVQQFYDKNICLSFDSFCATTDSQMKDLSKNFEENPIDEEPNEDNGYYTSSATDLESPSIEFKTSLEDHQKDFNKELKKMKKISRKLSLLSTKNGGFSQKKIAHATAESRYRSSINEQIKRLKTLVAGPNANWKKSAILETVAEYIQQLKTANSNLIEENLQLKMRLSHSTATQMTTTPLNTSYLFVPTVGSLTNASQISTLMYSCI